MPPSIACTGGGRWATPPAPPVGAHCSILKAFGPKKTYSWITNTWKVAEHHSLSEKCKSKPQWGTISRRSGWLLSKHLQAINAWEKGTLLLCCGECKLVQPLWRTFLFCLQPPFTVSYLAFALHPVTLISTTCVTGCSLRGVKSLSWFMLFLSSQCFSPITPRGNILLFQGKVQRLSLPEVFFDLSQEE